MKTFGVGGLATQQRVKHAVLVLLFAAILFKVPHALAEPRSELPPWPEQTLGIWGFNEALTPYAPTRVAVGAESAQTVESWSGYSLTRNWQAVTPVAVPVTDSHGGKPNFTTAQGTIRVWFCPDWSSASLEGKGPGGYARLIELVGLSGKEPETFYSLYLNPEGTAIYLSGQGVGGPTDFLKAEVNWTAGQWHLLALNYDGKQTSLSIDAVTVANGAGMPNVPAWKKDALALLIGSDIAAGNAAQGQFDELCTFDDPQSPDDLRFYWRGMYRTVAMGPLGTPAEEQLKMQSWNEQLAMTTMESGYELPPFPEEGDTNSTGGGTYEWTPTVYPSNALWLEITSVTNDVANIIIHGTIPYVWYELLSKEDLTNDTWQSESPLWPGAEGQDWTPATVPVGTRTNHLFLWAKSWVDEDGNGIPDWWEQQYLGAVGVDPYGDPDGDGWGNFQEYQNATSPTGFNTPPAPQGFAVELSTNGASSKLTWAEATGNVTNYVIERSFDSSTIEVPAGTTSYTDTSSLLPTGLFFSGNEPAYRIQAQYAGGVSAQTDWTSDTRSRAPQAELVGSEDGYATVVGAIPPTAVALRVGYWSQQVYEPPVSVAEWDIPVANITNNTVLWTSNMVASSYQSRYARWISTNNVPSAARLQVDAVPSFFWDGRAALLENLRFLLRSGNKQIPFNYVSGGPYSDWPTDNFPDYAYAGFHLFDYFPSIPGAYLDEFKPFRFNTLYRNFVFAETNAYSSGFLATGVGSFSSDSLSLDSPSAYEFSAPSSPMTIPTMLATNETRWTYFIPESAEGDLGLIGISTNGGNWTLGSNERNLYGLRYLSAKYACSTNGGFDLFVTTLGAGGSMPTNDVGYFYPEAEQPILQNVGYYFCRPYIDLFPGHDTFSPTNTTSMMFAGVGQPTEVAGYAKLAIANGYTNKVAYLGQYFDKAFAADGSGNRSTNTTGFLSPYGQFVPIEPGKTFLTTKPDGVSTNVGECVVHAIKLQLDVNHDGVMQTSWTSPDNTSSQKPFVFWVNNDWDVNDLELGGKDVNPQGATWPDNFIGPTIRSSRDLEDFARLWILGLPALHPTNGYTLTLSWRNVFGAPAIRLFRAYETNGGTGYLQDTNIAAIQAQPSLGFLTNAFGDALGLTITEARPFTFPTNYFTIEGTNAYFLFEGAGVGKGELVLTIYQGATAVAETSAFLDLKDVKDLYEQVRIDGVTDWTPNTDLSYFKEDKHLASTPEEDKSLVLFVHGWRMGQWDYYNFSESMFKRLYWQGYHGRFAALRWRTLSKDDFTLPLLDLFTYNKSEFRAFVSGNGISDYLTHLRQRFPDYHIGVCAHSMGNIAMMEALKLQEAAGVTNIDNFVLMQAAVPAHCYDSSLPDYGPFTTAEASHHTPDAYRGYPGGINAAVRNSIVNFFNTNDFALATGVAYVPLVGDIPVSWEANQINYKPDLDLGYTSDGTNAYKNFDLVTDSRQIMSFAARPRSKAVGALPGVGGVITGGQVDLKGNFGFDTDKSEHSAQFNWNIQRTWGFYSQLISSLFPQQP